ncbi:MAG: SIS domain-containing protein [Trueperaceae bacterium]|nr:SIS domain-containing protein [Trueperaceae bacterium]
MQSGIKAYFDLANQQLAEILNSQLSVMTEVAELWTKAIQANHLLYSFGSGHSRYIAGELYFRAGGLAPVMTIHDPSMGSAERLEGFAETFIENYPVERGDLLLVISNSGINPLPIEIAMWAKTQGAKVIALTNLAQSQEAKSRHSSGKKLYECADYVLDNCGSDGDAGIDIPGYSFKVGPSSTLTGVAILNAIVTQTAFNLAQAGQTPPVLVSANVPAGDAHNQTMIDTYWPRLASFPLRKIKSG